MLGKSLFFSCCASFSSSSSSAWDEIYEVFGDGHDYDWALVDEEEPSFDDEAQKQETRYQDVSTLFWSNFAY